MFSRKPSEVVYVVSLLSEVCCLMTDIIILSTKNTFSIFFLKSFHLVCFMHQQTINYSTFSS